MRNALLPPLAILSLSLIPAAAAGDDVDRNTTWAELRSDGQSLVFGRLQGRFDGPDYRGRKIRIRNLESEDESLIPVEDGLGYFEATLRTGTYAVVAIESTYFPPIRPMRPNRYPPVRQRYEIRPTLPTGLPTFPVVTEHPLYLGTIRSTANARGLVYEGHQLEIVDDFDNAWQHLQVRHPRLVASLTRVDVDPGRYFFVKPRPVETVADLSALRDPLEQARIYIEERRFDQAVNWLATIIPMSDAEREDVGVLLGEALLADKKYREAIDELGDVLLDNPENDRALRLLARAHAFEGHEADALNLYQALGKLVPNDAEASLHLGYYYARKARKAEAKAQFESAFEVNFDYLLHDSTPYAMALRAEGVDYEPPRIVDGAIRAPSTLRSRRGSKGAFAMLLDHTGKVVAVHLTPDAETWAPAMMMSVINAKFKPAQLNGVSIPSLVILGTDSRFESIQ